MTTTNPGTPPSLDSLPLFASPVGPEVDDLTTPRQPDSVFARLRRAEAQGARHLGDVDTRPTPVVQDPRAAYRPPVPVQVPVPMTAPATGVPAPTPQTVVGDAEFWRDVAMLRGTVAERLARMLADRPGLDDAAREELGRGLILGTVEDHSQALLESGRPGIPDSLRSRLSRALFDAMFRLGRFQSLVDRSDVENIEIYGHDHVILEKTDGTFEEAGAIAESDRDLIDFLKFLAARDPDNEQAFSRSSYKLELPLPGRARLAAVAWVVPRPRVTIRLQRLKRVDLAMLRATGELDLVLEQFLTAAVRARKTIVVSGKGQGSGKTTLLRALCAALDPMESVATIETDYELYLHDDPERHKRVTPFQARTGAGELTAGGGRAGQVTTGMLMHDALRHNIRRVIVGEVRGPEIVTMFEAMQAGNGSMSTVHADSARDVVERLAGLAARDATLSEDYAYRQIAQTIDLIVYIARDERADGSSHRYITQVIECTRGEGANPVATSDVFAPDVYGRAVPANAPTFMDDLVRAGFDRTLFAYRGGMWDEEDAA